MGSKLWGGLALAATLSIMSMPRNVRADDSWSTWQSFEHARVSVSFNQVNKETWTWKFRNDGADTITFMEFEYTDKTGTHHDVLPGSLKPGHVFGGWAAFTASSNPSIHITKVTRK
jgi:hypothetical protein